MESLQILYDARFLAARSPLTVNIQQMVFYNESAGLVNGFGGVWNRFSFFGSKRNGSRADFHASAFTKI